MKELSDFHRKLMNANIRRENTQIPKGQKDHSGKNNCFALSLYRGFVMPFTLAENMFMFYCYTVHICKENCPTKEPVFGFLVNCLVCFDVWLLLLGLDWLGVFSPFSLLISKFMSNF